MPVEFFLTSGAGPSRRIRGRARNISPHHSTSTRRHPPPTTATSRHAPPTASTSWHPPAEWTLPPGVTRVYADDPSNMYRYRPAPADLLEDDEEERMIKQSAAEGSDLTAHYHKPTMNDLHGNERHIGHKLKDLLWAFSIKEGTLATRGIYHGWFDALFEGMWEEEMTGKPFETPSHEAATVAINNIASRRGRVKDRVRTAIRYGCGFVDPLNGADRNKNNKIYRRNWPNLFHCLNIKTGYGHYEGELVTKCITAAFFHSPTAIGVKYENFFMDMRFTIVAFVLAVMQFCIGEWKDGNFTNTKLDANYLLSLYICHYEGLKEAKKKAPVRMLGLRKKWFTQSMVASGAKATRQKFIQRITLQENVRPDTPRSSPVTGRPSLCSPQSSTAPGSPGPSRPLQTRRAPSLDVSVCPFGTPPPYEPTPPLSPADEEPPERDSEGRYTTRAKGKGRASD